MSPVRSTKLWRIYGTQPALRPTKAMTSRLPSSIPLFIRVWSLEAIFKIKQSNPYLLGAIEPAKNSNIVKKVDSSIIKALGLLSHIFTVPILLQAKNLQEREKCLKIGVLHLIL